MDVEKVPRADTGADRPFDALAAPRRTAEEGSDGTTSPIENASTAAALSSTSCAAAGGIDNISPTRTQANDRRQAVWFKVITRPLLPGSRPAFNGVFK